MSASSEFCTSAPRRLKTTALAVAALLTVGLSAAPVAFAQDASPMASPAATCDAPALPPGAPSTPSADSGTPLAGALSATPEAATPEAAAPEGTPADDATGAEILAAVNNIAACVNSGNYEGAVGLITANFIMYLTGGSSNPYDAVAGIDGQQFGDFAASNPMTYDDGSVSADVVYMGTQYQQNSERWFLMKDDADGYWKLDHYDSLASATELDTAVVGVNLVGPDDTGAYSIVPTANDTVGETPAIVFHATNMGSEPHELVVLKLPEGVDPAGLFDGTLSEKDVEFIGQVGPLDPLVGSATTGGQADLTLLNLPAGVYTLACFVTGPDGKPHAANGMVLNFEVTAAS